MDKKNFFKVKAKDSPAQEQENFYVTNSNTIPVSNIFVSGKSKTKKRINAFDTELIDETSTSDQQNDITFLPVTKLENLKKELKKIDENIAQATMLKEEILIRDLQIERYKIICKIEVLKEQIASSKIYHLPSNEFISFAQKTILAFLKKYNSTKNFINNKILIKLLKPISKTQKLKDVIMTLNTLNNSVNELSSFHIPYGEKEERYKELEKYIAQANSIHSIIQREIKHEKYKK